MLIKITTTKNETLFVNIVQPETFVIIFLRFVVFLYLNKCTKISDLSASVCHVFIFYEVV